MIKFQELKVTKDGKHLIIDAVVKSLQYYKDIYIDAIIIDTQDTFISNGPSSNPIYYYEIPKSNNPEIVGQKEVRLELDYMDLGVDINKTLFFVYIIAKGTPAANTPCNMDNATTLGVTANLYNYYNYMLQSMKEIENDCVIPKNFIDSILRFKALELSIKTGHYPQAIKYWNKFFINLENKVTNICSCHGQI